MPTSAFVPVHEFWCMLVWHGEYYHSLFPPLLNINTTPPPSPHSSHGISVSFRSNCARWLFGGAFLSPEPLVALWFNSFQYVCNLDSTSELLRPPQEWGAGQEGESSSLQLLFSLPWQYIWLQHLQRGKILTHHFWDFSLQTLALLLLASEAEHLVHRSVRRDSQGKVAYCDKRKWSWSALDQCRPHFRHLLIDRGFLCHLISVLMS